jgi:3-isopropylmalate/(R)-2-methylmalate dehydratase small subunit
MQPFTTLTGVAAPLLLDDVNTDQITPTGLTRSLKPDYASILFSRWRRCPDGSENPDFVLNRPQYRGAKILVVGRNFGCGSSREGAVWAMAAFGIRCIVARSFADLYRDNFLKNVLLPVVLAPDDHVRLESLAVAVDGVEPFTVDLAQQKIFGPEGAIFGFEIAPAEKDALLEGLDEIGFTLKYAAAIAAWEAATQADRPWLQQMVDRRNVGTNG